MKCIFRVGVGKVEITPPVGSLLVGGLKPYESEYAATPLYVKAIVISAGDETAAIVTLDTLKYPIGSEAAKQAADETGLPVSNIFITASHTHSAPYYTDYGDELKGAVVESLKAALSDLSPCGIGMSKETVGGIIHNRRVMKEGHCWNTWLLPKEERGLWPAAGAVDEEVSVLSFVGEDGRNKAILFNFACHACTSGATPTAISADYPGYVRKYVDEQLGYRTETLFLPGACGDINGLVNSETMGKAIAAAIVKSLENAEFAGSPRIDATARETELSDRNAEEFQEAEVSLIWEKGLENFARSYEETKQLQRQTHKACLAGLRIGDDIAVVTNPVELFVDIGLAIKKGSSFRHTMVAEQTNGALGYVPTARAFEQGGYESFYGEHSYLGVDAGDIIFKESLDILETLKKL